jgi:hypothetical protein
MFGGAAARLAPVSRIDSALMIAAGKAGQDVVERDVRSDLCLQFGRRADLFELALVQDGDAVAALDLVTIGPPNRTLSSSLRSKCRSLDRSSQKEPQHFARSIRPMLVCEGTFRAASRPSVPQSLDSPMFHLRSAARIGNHSARVSTASGRAAMVGLLYSLGEAGARFGDNHFGVRRMYRQIGRSMKNNGTHVAIRIVRMNLFWRWICWA